MNSQVQLKRMKYEGGSNATDKCIEILVRLITSKDEHKREQISRDIKRDIECIYFNHLLTQSKTDLEEHQAAKTLFRTLCYDKYDEFEDTFKTLDETAKVVLIQHLDLKDCYLNVRYLEMYGKISLKPSPVKDLLERLRSNTSAQPTEVIVEAQETSSTDNENGSEAALKCIEMAKELIESKDYSSMKNLAFPIRFECKNSFQT